MPEAVPPNTLLQLDSPRCGANVVAHDRLRPVRAFALGMRTGKDPIFSLAEGSMSTPFQQGLSQRVVKGYRLLRCFRLADPDNLTNDGASYTCLLCGEVDVLPL